MAEAEQGAWGIREMATAMKMPPSTIHRVLVTLESQGMVSAAGNGRYQLGLELLRIASKVAARNSLAEAAAAPMRHLAELTGESVLLGVYDRSRMEMMYIAAVESRHPLRYVVQLFDWLPLHAGVGGLAILSFLPDLERQRIIGRKRLVPLTTRTITDPELLEKAADRFRRRGYVITVGHRIAGAVGIGAPVVGHDDEVVGDVVLTIPESRFEARSEDNLGRLVIKTAQAIGRGIGGR
jgi:IclR family acetate operon transcriptional repressor